MRQGEYRRSAAAEYAKRWALGRNPAYADFDLLGGDCTNFTSQCIYAGSGVMNYSPDGWFYRSLNDRAPAWTGVESFYRFLVSNHGPGPFGSVVSGENISVGDVIQLGNHNGVFYHSLFVLQATSSSLYIAAHTQDSLWRTLDSYEFERIRYLQILGVNMP